MQNHSKSARVACCLAAIAGLTLAAPDLVGGQKTAVASRDSGSFLLKDRQRVLFLGDSNTFDGKFIAYLDAYLCTRFPDKRIELINLGLPSETVSGLSEPDHPYARPNVHDRVAHALELCKPDVVVICYGMNDGIYYPFSEERFKKYQEGTSQLIRKVEAAGAKPILMSPAPFDPVPLKDRVQSKNAEKFSWLRPYEQYDEAVLTKYSDWLVSLRDKKYTVIDAHAALLKHLAAMRKEEPGYRVSADGIHPNANGHLVIALEILKELQAPAAVKDIAIDVTKDPPTHADVKIGVLKRNALSFSFALPRAMPADPAWTVRARMVEHFDDRLNRYALKVEGMKGLLAISVGHRKEGKSQAPITADELAKGVNLAKLIELPQDSRGAEIWKLVAEKNRLLGLAWLTHVGHKRPDTPKGIALADAVKKAAVLDAEIRRLCAPTEISISIGLLGK